MRLGVNVTSGANGVDFTIRVRQTSTHAGLLYGIALQQKPVPIKWEIYKNLDKYPNGYIIALGCTRGYLNPPGFSHGAAEAGDLTFTVVGMNGFLHTKGSDLGTATQSPTPVPGSYQGGT